MIISQSRHLTTGPEVQIKSLSHSNQPPTAFHSLLPPRTLIPSPSLLPRAFDKIPFPLLGCLEGSTSPDESSTTSSITSTTRGVLYFRPSFLPSVRASFFPTFRPSVCPSFLPVVRPSFLPACLHSFLPPARPSLLPSFRPSVRLSFLPSGRPSVLPASFKSWRSRRKSKKKIETLIISKRHWTIIKYL